MNEQEIESLTYVLNETEICFSSIDDINDNDKFSSIK